MLNSDKVDVLSTRLLSITTRIKTFECANLCAWNNCVLDYCPLQQGLRHLVWIDASKIVRY